MNDHTLLISRSTGGLLGQLASDTRRDRAADDRVAATRSISSSWMMRISSAIVFVAFSWAASTWATPVRFETTGVQFAYSGVSLPGSESESAGDAYQLDVMRESVAGSRTVTLTDFILQLIGIDLSELTGEMTGDVSYSTEVRVTGDPGTRVLVRATNYAGEGSFHEILALPRGDATSAVSNSLLVRRSATLDQIWMNETSVSRNHTDYAFVSDAGVDAAQFDSDPFEMIVGDPAFDSILLDGTFRIHSLGRIDDYGCAPIIGCVPGTGYAVSSTLGSFSVGLQAETIPDVVPEPGTLALLGIGLVLLRGIVRLSARGAA